VEDSLRSLGRYHDYRLYEVIAATREQVGYRVYLLEPGDFIGVPAVTGLVIFGDIQYAQLPGELRPWERLLIAKSLVALQEQIRQARRQRKEACGA
jgi:hypothetical protein